MKKIILLMSLIIFSFVLANAQTEINDSIKTQKEKKVYSDPIYEMTTPNENSKIIIDKTNNPGFYISRAAKHRLAGIGIGASTSLLFVAGAFDNVSVDMQESIAWLSGITSLAFWISGEFSQIKAGKLMEKHNLSIVPTSEGIGLAINF